MLKKELNMVIDWSKISKKDYLTAMEHSSVKDTDIKLLLREALTDKVDDRELYLRCIDYSFMYEDFECFRAADLDKQHGGIAYSQLSK